MQKESEKRKDPNYDKQLICMLIYNESLTFHPDQGDGQQFELPPALMVESRQKQELENKHEEGPISNEMKNADTTITKHDIDKVKGGADYQQSSDIKPSNEDKLKVTDNSNDMRQKVTSF